MKKSALWELGGTCSSAAVLFTTFIEHLRLNCSSAEAGIALNLFLNFEQN